MKKVLSYEIALAGIGTALAVICIVLSYYLPVMTLSFYALSGIFLMLPLIQKKLRSGILAFVASGILGFVFTNYIAILPYLFIFGSGVIIMYVCLVYLKKYWYISIPIKIVFVNLGLFGMYKLMGFDNFIYVFDWIGISPTYIWIALIATPIYLAYDYLLQRIFLYLANRFNKRFKLSNTNHNTDSDSNDDLF